MHYVTHLTQFWKTSQATPVQSILVHLAEINREIIRVTHLFLFLIIVDPSQQQLKLQLVRVLNISTNELN